MKGVFYLKVGIYTDAHFSISSSILKVTSTYKYSARLDMLVDSFKWMYQEFDKYQVDLIVNGGDLLESTTLKAIEATALSEAISYSSGIPEYHLVGNHERENQQYSLLSILNGYQHINVVTKVSTFGDLTFLPFEDDYRDLDISKYRSKVLISHSMYEGIRLGHFISDSGLSIDYVSNYFELILNGHIHSRSPVVDTEFTGKFHNIGSIVGHNFSDNYTNGLPGIVILDTETLTLDYVVNPYSVLFYKIKVTNLSDLISTLSSLPKNPKCIEVKVSSLISSNVFDYINSNLSTYSIVSTRLLVDNQTRSLVSELTVIENVDRYSLSNFTELETYLKSLGLNYSNERLTEFCKEYLSKGVDS